MRTKYIIAKKQTKHKSQSIKNVSSLSNNTLVSTHSNEFCTGCHRKVNIMNIISIACKGKGVKGINNKMQKTGTCEYGHKWRQSTKQTKLSNNKKQSLMRGGTGYNPPGAAAPEAEAAAAAAAAAEPHYVSVAAIKANKTAAAAVKEAENAAADAAAARKAAARKAAAKQAAANPYKVAKQAADAAADAAANKAAAAAAAAVKEAENAAEAKKNGPELHQKLLIAKNAFINSQHHLNNNTNWEKTKQRIINEHNIKQGVIQNPQQSQSRDEKHSSIDNIHSKILKLKVADLAEEEPLPQLPQVSTQSAAAKQAAAAEEEPLPPLPPLPQLPQVSTQSAAEKQAAAAAAKQAAAAAAAAAAEEEQLPQLPQVSTQSAAAKQAEPYVSPVINISTTSTSLEQQTNPKQPDANNQARSALQSPPKRTSKLGFNNFAKMIISPSQTFKNFKTGAKDTYNMILRRQKRNNKPKQPDAINQRNQPGNNIHLPIDTFHEQLSKLALNQSSNKQAQNTSLPPLLPPRTYNNFTLPDRSTPTKNKILPPINQAQSIQQPSPKRTVKSYLKNFTSMFTSPRKPFHNFTTGTDPFKPRARAPDPDPGPYKTIKH